MDGNSTHDVCKTTLNKHCRFPNHWFVTWNVAASYISAAIIS